MPEESEFLDTEQLVIFKVSVLAFIDNLDQIGPGSWVSPILLWSRFDNSFGHDLSVYKTKVCFMVA